MRLEDLLNEMRDVNDDVSSAINALKDLDSFYISMERINEREKIIIGRMFLENLQPKIQKWAHELDIYIVEHNLLE